MKRLNFLLIFYCSLTFFLPTKAEAIVDPLTVPNNKFGIHIIDESDIEDANLLVNSNGGEWGYVTLIIRDDDMDQSKWQRIFDKLREKKLIPLVRIATHGEGNVWVKPKKEDADKWAKFLTSLNWVVKNRYVILFNEPNHQHEWEGQIAPSEYAQIAQEFRNKLKEKSEDFFILPAGLDAAAPNSKTTMEISSYMNQMERAVPGIFKLFDGWNSHSYPNPGFVGSPFETGKATIKGWEWEMGYLKRFGVNNLPVFITETGWRHSGPTNNKVLGISTQKVAEFYTHAFNSVWEHKQIVAVTPFVLNYPQEPFTNFSWKNAVTGTYYPQFQAVQNISKVTGKPIQEMNSTFISSSMPEKVFSHSKYGFGISFKNTGQGIWDDKVSLSFEGELKDSLQIQEAPLNIKPGNEGNFRFSLDTENVPEGKHTVKINLKDAQGNFGEVYEKDIHVTQSPLVKIILNTLFFQKAGEITLSITQNNTNISEHKISSDEEKEFKTFLNNLVPGEKYRFTVSEEGFITKSREQIIKEDTTEIDIGFFLPFDKDQDGKFTFSDLF